MVDRLQHPNGKFYQDQDANDSDEERSQNKECRLLARFAYVHTSFPSYCKRHFSIFCFISFRITNFLWDCKKGKKLIFL